MDYKKINISIENYIGKVELNSPRNLNAFDELMVSEVTNALNELDKNEEVKVIVLSGKGKGFSAGGDIGYFYQELKKGEINLEGKVKAIGLLSLTIKKLSKPVIASVHGAVAGASFNIAVACDFCIASEDAKFLQAFVNIGLVPDAAGVFLLTRAIGVNKATDLIMTGKLVSANEACDLGLVNKVVKIDDLKSETFELAKKLCNGPGTSYKNMKKMIFESQFKEMEQYLDLEDALQNECARTEDFKEGIFAFVEKRKANFIGK